MSINEFTDKHVCNDTHAEHCNGDCKSCEKQFSDDLKEFLDEHDKQIRADERNRVFSTLSKLIESDYNSKECKLLLSDLCETIL